MPEQYGGQSMPAVMGSAVTEHLMAANQAFSMYHGLTHGAASTIPAHGTEAQKDLFLPKMIACDWTGTMNLTEP
jgi:alkylation response protein AidB-like acyl-CoA dehydrogenase